jgi:ribosomal protein S18 acetylase RimI-like enzyme
MMLSTREVTADDVGFLTDVFLRAMRTHITSARGFWNEEKERGQFCNQLELSRTQIIQHKGESIGFLMTLNRGKDVELHTLCIAPEHQGHGFGTEITRRIVDDARARRCGVVLSVLKANTAARSLYGRLGFVVTEETAYHYRMRLVS